MLDNNILNSVRQDIKQMDMWKMQHRHEQGYVSKKQHVEDCKIQQVSQLVTGLARQGTGQETGQQAPAVQLEDGEKQVPYIL